MSSSDEDAVVARSVTVRKDSLWLTLMRCTTMRIIVLKLGILFFFFITDDDFRRVLKSGRRLQIVIKTSDCVDNTSVFK